MLPENVNRILERESLEYYEFPEGTTPTSKPAAGMLGVKVGQIAKSILFVGKSGTSYLMVCPEDRKVSPSKLKKVVGEKTGLPPRSKLNNSPGFFQIEYVPLD